MNLSSSWASVVAQSQQDFKVRQKVWELSLQLYKLQAAILLPFLGNDSMSALSLTRHCHHISSFASLHSTHTPLRFSTPPTFCHISIYCSGVHLHQATGWATLLFLLGPTCELDVQLRVDTCAPESLTFHHLRYSMAGCWRSHYTSFLTFLCF